MNLCEFNIIRFDYTSPPAVPYMNVTFIFFLCLSLNFKTNNLLWEGSMPPYLPDGAPMFSSCVFSDPWAFLSSKSWIRPWWFAGCLALVEILDILEIYLNFLLLVILEFSWNFARSPGNFMVLWHLLRLIWCNDGCWCDFPVTLHCPVMGKIALTV